MMMNIEKTPAYMPWPLKLSPKFKRDSQSNTFISASSIQCLQHLLHLGMAEANQQKLRAFGGEHSQGANKQVVTLRSNRIDVQLPQSPRFPSTIYEIANATELVFSKKEVQTKACKVPWL